VEVLEALWPTLTWANEHKFRMHVKRYPLCFIPTTSGFSADAWVTGPQEVCYKVSLHAVSILDTDYAQCEKDMIAGGGKTPLEMDGILNVLSEDSRRVVHNCVDDCPETMSVSNWKLRTLGIL
jgi:hypothetical protein